MVPESVAIRKLQAQAIVEQLHSELQTSDGKVLLAGDFNTNPGTEPVELLGAILTDSWLEAGAGAGATIPSDAPTVRWDYIFHGAGFAGATKAEVIDTTASDPRAVVGTLPVMP